MAIDTIEGLFGEKIHYKDGEKIGESWPGLFGGSWNHYDADGNPVVPEEPNGYKYEQLVLDMIVQLDSCLPFEVVREKEFAPIKNKTGVDSVESARELCKMNGIEL